MYGLPLQSVRFMLMRSVSANALLIAIPELNRDLWGQPL